MRRTLRWPFLCQCCEGRGGWTEWVCDDGGPYYACDACDETGMMTWAGRLRWWACCEGHARPVAAVLDEYYGLMMRWHDRRGPSDEVRGW